MKPEDDPVSYAQAHWSMATGLMTAGSPVIARRHYQMTLKAIKDHDIRFVKSPPKSGVAVSFTEQDHERAVLLGKIIHFESFLSLYLSGMPGARPWDDGNREAALSVGFIYLSLENSFNPEIDRHQRNLFCVKLRFQSWTWNDSSGRSYR
jgi:hypothetical protein